MVSVVRFSRKLFQGAIFSNVLFGEPAVPVQLRQKERKKERKEKKTGRHILVKQEAAAESCCRCLPAAIFLFLPVFYSHCGQSFIPTLYAHMEPRLIISVN